MGCTLGCGVAGTTGGAHRACILLGIIATCRTLGVPSKSYMVWAFERVGTYRDLFDLPIADLMPAAVENALAR